MVKWLKNNKENRDVLQYIPGPEAMHELNYEYTLELYWFIFLKALDPEILAGSVC